MATSSSTASTSPSARTASSTRSGTDDAADHHRNHGNAQQPPIREGSSSRLRLRQRRDHHHRRRRDDDDDRGDDIISVRANCAIQGLVASSVLFAWQLVYTLPNIRTLILLPMSKAGTSPPQALLVLSAISLSNLLHSATFFVALKHLAGGATSAGVLKGLQAVLVFAASSALLCGRWEGTGEETCWSASKLVSLSVASRAGYRAVRGGDAAAARRRRSDQCDDDDAEEDDGGRRRRRRRRGDRVRVRANACEYNVMCMRGSGIIAGLHSLISRVDIIFSWRIHTFFVFFRFNIIEK